MARGPPAIEALFDGGFDAPQDPAPRRRGTPGVKAHDYIVVGAGSAGCVLANRLSESGQHSVLLLEAGPRDTNPWIHIPLGYGKLFTNARVNWAYESEPEPALEGRRIFTPRGKVLGGSSSINGLVHIRGQREDFDGWRVPGWGFDDLLPYFIKSEDHSRGASRWHGSGGPLAVSDLPDRHELCDAFIASAQANGIPRNDDFNGEKQEGTGYYQANIRNGRRISSAVGYLRPARKRPNLAVETDALVTRVLFEGQRASGVEYLRGGVAQRAQAREVILAGGAFNSPQLLQLSGVGPGERLQRLGIPVVLDSPDVGECLQDHLYVRTFWRCNRPITINDDLASVWRTIGVGLRYLLQRRGPLTVSAGWAAAFARTRAELARPDAQFYFINFSVAKRGGVLDRFSGFTCSMSQLQAESRGWVRLRSADPREAPAIHYNYLSSEREQRTMVDGLKLLRRIVQTPPLSAYVAEERVPGKQVRTDDEWLAFCRATAETVYHPTSTCRMGVDARSVVDERLRVRGVAGLRVIDASVMPSVISGNTNASVVAIAEKGAALALEDAKRTDG